MGQIIAIVLSALGIAITIFFSSISVARRMGGIEEKLENVAEGLACARESIESNSKQTSVLSERTAKIETKLEFFTPGRRPA